MWNEILGKVGTPLVPDTHVDVVGKSGGGELRHVLDTGDGRNIERIYDRESTFRSLYELSREVIGTSRPVNVYLLLRPSQHQVREEVSGVVRVHMGNEDVAKTLRLPKSPVDTSSEELIVQSGTAIYDVCIFANHDRLRNPPLVYLRGRTAAYTKQYDLRVGVHSGRLCRLARRLGIFVFGGLGLLTLSYLPLLSITRTPRECRGANGRGTQEGRTLEEIPP